MRNLIHTRLSSLLKVKDRTYFVVIFLLSIIIYTATIQRVGSILWGDSLYYYAYTRSIVVDRDIDFSNEAYRDNDGFPNEPTISQITGKVINKFSPGSSILWIPAVAEGYFYEKIFYRLFPSRSTLTNLEFNFGYSKMTQSLVAIYTILFSTLGLFFSYKTLVLFFNKKIALISLLFLYLTTQMFYYTSIDPLNSHSASFMLASLFLYLTITFSKKLNWQKMIVLGLLGGMITLVRNQDLVLLIPSAIYLFTRKREGMMDFVNRKILFWGSAFLVFSIQIFTTLYLYGQLASPYILGGEKLSWLRPDFIRVLLSFENGLFFFAPVTFFATLGLFFILKNRKNEKKILVNFAFVSIFVFLLQLYVVASWGREIIGGPYGSRMFISTLPFIFIGFGYLLKQLKRFRNFSPIIFVVLLILFANNLLQTGLMLINY